MCRWVPVEVFIEMGLYRDWSCLRFPCTKTAIQTLFPLSRDPLSWAQCIVSRWTCDSAKMCNYRNLSGSSVCVCVFVSKKVRQNERD